MNEVIAVLQKMNSSIKPESIRDQYRLGKYDPERPRPRPILVQFLRSADASRILSKMSSVEAPHAIQPYMSPTELARNTILLKERWAIHTDTGIDLKHIKICKHSISVVGKLHGTLDIATNKYVEKSNTLY